MDRVFSFLQRILVQMLNRTCNHTWCKAVHSTQEAAEDAEHDENKEQRCDDYERNPAACQTAAAQFATVHEYSCNHRLFVPEKCKNKITQIERLLGGAVSVSYSQTIVASQVTILHRDNRQLRHVAVGEVRYRVL